MPRKRHGCEYEAEEDEPEGGGKEPPSRRTIQPSQNPVVGKEKREDLHRVKGQTP
jgi:hypothetical protein